MSSGNTAWRSDAAATDRRPDSAGCAAAVQVRSSRAATGQPSARSIAGKIRDVTILLCIYYSLIHAIQGSTMERFKSIDIGTARRRRISGMALAVGLLFTVSAA